MVFLVQVDHNRLKFLSDKIVGMNDFKKRLGQLLYLKNLAKVGSKLYNLSFDLES